MDKELTDDEQIVEDLQNEISALHDELVNKQEEIDELLAIIREINILSKP